MIQKLRGSPRADARNAGVTVGNIAYECEQVWNERGIDAKLFANGGRTANRFSPAVDLHDTRTAHALGQIFIGCPDGDLLNLPLFRCKMRGGSERIISFELDHRPDHNAHCRERFFERMELREQRPLDPCAGLVVRPKAIPKRLDHVIGGHTDVRVAVFVLDYLKNGLQHADDSAIGAVLAFGKPAQPVEVAEELVGSVN